MAVNEAFKEFSIEGKGALVIGAELPLSSAAAQTLAEAGANVVLASQDPGTGDALKELSKQITAAGRKAVVKIQTAATRAIIVSIPRARSLGRRRTRSLPPSCP